MKFRILLALTVSAFTSRLSNASVVTYDSTGGGSYNAVGPIYPSPQYIGDKFTVTTSGSLDTIELPLSSSSFDNKPVKGKIMLWSDADGFVGTALFSASVSTTNPPANSNNELPPFTVVSANPNHPIVLFAGAKYWLTLSETDGREDLVGYSAVYLTSLEGVNFNNHQRIYTEGSQPLVALVKVNPISVEPGPATNFISFSATALFETNPTNALPIPAPFSYLVNSKRILNWLALDEYRAGMYPNRDFPADARLALIGTKFEVVDKNKKPIVDVSNILTGHPGAYYLTNLKKTPREKSLQISQTSREIFYLNYDDSNIEGGAGVTFHLSGLLTSTVAVTPVKIGEAAESTTDKLSSASGEGTLQGAPFIITGSFTASSTPSNTK